MKKLSINDFIPKLAKLKLSTIDNELTLKPWSLRVKAWAVAKYGAGELNKIMKEMDTIKISEIAYFMLDDESKKNFKNEDAFFEAIQGTLDELAVHKAVLETMGIGELELEELSKLVVEAVELPDPKGAPSSDKNAN